MSIPYQPQNLQSQQADGNILLTWNGSLGATSYTVYRGTDGVNFPHNVNVGNVNQYVDSLPGVGIAYYYQVVANSNAGAYAYATLTFSGQPNSGDVLSIANVSFTAGTSFAIGATTAITQTNLSNAINTALPTTVIASSSGNVVTLTVVYPGAEGNGLEFGNGLTNVVGVPFSNGITPVSSPASSITMMIAAPPSEMSLYELRLRSQQTADRVESAFVGTSEWNAFIRLAMYELYDILMTSYEDYFASAQAFVQTNGTTANYPLPDGVSNYLGGTYGGTSGTPAQAFYKLAGVDLNVNTSTITPSRVSLLRFDFIKRNQYVYPNSTSTIYGVYNMRYRLMGNNINIIPTPAGNQTLVLWYSPKLPALLADTDLTTLGTSGWLRYVIVRAAKYALDKEEGSDTSKLDAELLYLKTRIEQAASNRDAGQADTISETRQDMVYGGSGWGGGGQAGW